jgi:hypothetical protein
MAGDQNCSMSVPAWHEISTPSRSPSRARHAAAAKSLPMRLIS